MKITDDKHPLALHISLLKTIAMWPPCRTDVPFRIWYYSTLVLIYLFASNLLMTLVGKIISSIQEADVDGIATTVDFATVVISGMFRLVYITFRGGTYIRLINEMSNTFVHESFNRIGPTLTSKPIQAIGTKFSFMYFLPSLIFVLHMVFEPVIKFMMNPEDGPIALIFDGWYPADVTTEPTHTIMFASQAISWLVLGYHYLASDIFWYMIIILTMGQLKLLTHTYNNIISDDIEVESMELPNIMEDVAIKCFEHHQKIRRFIRNLENLLNPILFVDFMHAGISISFLLLDITIAISKNDESKVLYLTGYFLVSVVHMFCFDYLGNELIIQESALCKAMYNMPWHRSQKTLKMPLILTFSACRRPNRLTRGKIFFLSLEFFVQAMRTIFSYFMVILQLRNGKN